MECIFTFGSFCMRQQIHLVSEFHAIHTIANQNSPPHNEYYYFFGGLDNLRFFFFVINKCTHITFFFKWKINMVLIHRQFICNLKVFTLLQLFCVHVLVICAEKWVCMSFDTHFSNYSFYFLFLTCADIFLSLIFKFIQWN